MLEEKWVTVSYNNENIYSSKTDILETNKTPNKKHVTMTVAENI
jgi:hypothetical protein